VHNLLSTTIYPGTEWENISPSEAGFDPEKLKDAKCWLDERVGNGRYRVVIIRGGRLVAEWNHGVSRDQHLRLASAAKSIFSCILGIVIDKEKIPSADSKIIDYYPEAMDVPKGKGPKPGRFAFDKDRTITFRQLISNTSGYMKPGEEPGKVFHYQTYGMNILSHAIAKIYGLYDIRDPEGSPGFKQLVDEKLRIPIGASWCYYLMNFKLDKKKRFRIFSHKPCIQIFGYYDGVQASALDMARLGWLWCNWGRWEGKQLIPEAWLREATKTAPDIHSNCPREQWKYGYAFWTNDHCQLWPNLPRDSYAASGAGSQHIWVCPSLDLVVVQSPGLWQDQAENDTGLLRLVVDAYK
jgi:CubicO group peptidase (beta-lactamase class C family)